MVGTSFLFSLVWHGLQEHCLKRETSPPVLFSSVQFSCSVVSDSCDPIDCSMPGLPVHHQLLEFTQTYVCWVGDAIQPSHPLSFLSPQSYYLTFMNWPWFRITVWELELILEMTSRKLLAENEARYREQKNWSLCLLNGHIGFIWVSFSLGTFLSGYLWSCRISPLHSSRGHW